MHKRIEQHLRIWTALLAFSGYAALATSAEYGIPYLLVPVILVIFMHPGEMLDRRFKAYRYVTGLVTLLFTFTLPALVRRHSNVDFVVILATFVLAYKFIHVKKSRDYYQIFLMSLFLLLCASAQTPEPAIGFVYVLFLLSAVAALFMLQAYQGRAEDQPAPLLVAPSTNGRNSAVQANRRFLDRGLAVMLGTTAVACFLVMAGLFMITPRMEAGFLAREDPTLNVTGLTDTVDLTRGGTIAENSAVTMRVRFPQEPGGRYEGPMYWRVTTLPSYDGRQWRRAPVAPSMQGQVPGEQVSTRDGRARRLPYHVTTDLRMVRQEIELDKAPKQGLPCMPWPVQVSALDDQAYLIWDQYRDMTVQLSGETDRSLRYVVESDVRRFSADELRQDTVSSAQELAAAYAGIMRQRDYELLTAQNLRPDTRSRLADVIEGAETLYDAVKAIEDFLSSDEFTYSLSLPTLSSRFPVDEFIMQAKYGHCELFASAMALMVRSVGMPARLTSGYRGGEWDEAEGAYLVREDMAHMWVEVLFPELGWVIFDPSPWEETAGITPVGWLKRQYARYQVRMELFWYANVIGYSGGIQPETLSSLFDRVSVFSLTAQDDGAGMTDGSAIGEAAQALLFVVIFVVAAGVVGGLGLALLRSAGAPAPYTLTSDQRRAAALYRALLRRVHKRQPNGLTAGEVFGRVEVLPGVEPNQLERLREAYNDARFGGRPLPLERYRELRRMLKMLPRASKS